MEGFFSRRGRRGRRRGHRGKRRVLGYGWFYFGFLPLGVLGFSLVILLSTSVRMYSIYFFSIVKYEFFFIFSV